MGYYMYISPLLYIHTTLHLYNRAGSCQDIPPVSSLLSKFSTHYSSKLNNGELRL